MKGMILHDYEVRQLAATGKVLVVRVIKEPTPSGKVFPPGPGEQLWYFRDGYYAEEEHDVGRFVKCPLGTISTRFFVKEAFYLPQWRTVWYRADDVGFGVKWKSAATLPQPYSRFTVETEAVSVKRVQDATPDECRLAGEPAKNNDIGVRYGFGQTWNRHNPKHPWAENPWCWFVTMKRV